MVFLSVSLFSKTSSLIDYCSVIYQRRQLFLTIVRILLKRLKLHLIKTILAIFTLFIKWRQKSLKILYHIRSIKKGLKLHLIKMILIIFILFINLRQNLSKYCSRLGPFFKKVYFKNNYLYWSLPTDKYVYLLRIFKASSLLLSLAL